METNPRAPLREPGPEIPRPPGGDRNGQSILERKALNRFRLELAAMPASLVVQILLWPDKITDWAREEGVTPALVYNMLGGFKPYHSLRLRLAQRLGVAKGALDHLIDGMRPQPTSRRIPEPPADLLSALSADADAATDAPLASPPDDASLAGERPRARSQPARAEAVEPGDATHPGDDSQISFDL